MVGAAEWPGTHMNGKEKYASKVVAPEEAVRRIKNGDRVFLGSMCAEPTIIVEAMVESRVEDVEIIQFMTSQSTRKLASLGRDRFRIKTFLWQA